MQDLSPSTEQTWLSLRRHLERSDHFTLVLLISADPPALEIFYRRLEIQIPHVQRIPLDGAAAPWVEALETALAPDETLIQGHAPVWLALDRHPIDPGTDRQRDVILAALNQHRTQLERSFRRPLLIALPPPYLSRIWEIAPDLWAIRGTVIQIP